MAFGGAEDDVEFCFSVLFLVGIVRVASMCTQAGEGGHAEDKTIILRNGIVANWPLLLDNTETTSPTPTPIWPI